MAVVGVGHFGSFHCCKIQSLPGADLRVVVDVDSDRAASAGARFGAQALTSIEDLAGRVDAAVVAVPTPEHHQVAARLLAAGLDLLVEKPLAASSEQAQHLCELAARRARCLQVGHLERFNPIVREAFARIREPRYVRLERLGPFPAQGVKADVVFELMTHDLDLLLQLNGSPVESIEAIGFSVASPWADLASARLRFADGMLAELASSRVHPQRKRHMSVLDADGLLEIDLDARCLWRRPRGEQAQACDPVSCSDGDPLLEQDRAFVYALANGRQPKVGPEAGAAAVALAERIVRSIESGARG